MATRAFYLGTADPQKAPRMAPVIREIRALLSQYGSLKYVTLLDFAMKVGDLKRNSVKTWIAGAVSTGLLKQTGSYRPTDTRKLRIADWPECPHFCHCDYH